MKKIYVYTATGDPVKLGDVLTIDITVDEESLPALEELGVIKKVTVRPQPYIHTNIEWYVDKYRRRVGLSGSEFDFFCKLLTKNGSPALSSALLKEIALELDQKYDGHISKCDIVYAVNLTNLNIVPIKVTPDIDFTRFSAFRTVADAKFARKLVFPTHDINGKQENKKCFS